jgi:hypothetical protein
MTPQPVTCYGHTELRDMVIELRADVKHIDSRISDLVEIAKANNNRIVALETYNNQAIGEAKGVRTSAAIVSSVITLIGMAVAIIVSVVYR